MIDTAYSDRVHTSTSGSDKDEELLTEVRDRFKNWDAIWRKHRDERNTDIQYICGDPWDSKDRKSRVDAGRPCISHDELGQYVNQCVNNVRMNKRGIRADPRGFGSSEQTAQLRQDLIRTIEYDSNGPSIYASAYQQMVEGSYAFFRISRRYVSDHYIEEPAGQEADPGVTVYDARSAEARGQAHARNQALFQQEIVIKPVGNPNSVLFDPHCKEPDWSDAKGCFVLERVPLKEFKDRWPEAQIRDFGWEHRQSAEGWIFDDDILLAEYWRVETADKVVYQLEDGTVVADAGGRKSKKRTLKQRVIRQYITNGVEILQRSEEPEPGSIIPIIPMIGLERYLDEGGSGKRVLFSIVRLARDPQLSLAYLTSLEMEEAGLTPKTPFLGYKGQFDSNRAMWQAITKIPYAFLETDIPDNWPAGQVPPLPQRVPFTPNFQQYEIAKDSCRRAIQAAMGITPLPTAMQRDNQKSGVALERIESQEAIGSYHFVDGYDRALRLAGKVIDQWLPAVYGDQRDLHVRKPDDSYRLLKLNTDEPYPDVKDPLTLVRYPVEEVDHSIAVSSGPSYDSQRREIQSFLEALIVQLPNLPLAPPQAAQLLSLAIKMRNMGPAGDQMAQIIYPTEGSPDQTQQVMQQQQIKLQQQEMQLAQLQAIVQQLSMEKNAKITEGEYKMSLEKLRTETDLLIERLKVDAQMAVAQINAKSQVEGERAAAVQQANKREQEQLHEQEKLQQEEEHDLWLARQEYAKQMQEIQQQQMKAQSAQEGPTQ